MTQAKLILRKAMRASIALLPALLLSGPASAIEDVDGSYDRLPRAFQSQANVVANRMRDPGTTQFKSLYLHDNGLIPGTTALCGAINTRNAYGGYVGFDVFMISYASANGPPFILNALEHSPGARPYVRSRVLKACGVPER